MPHQGFVRSLRAQWLGDQLRALRVERGLTLAEVATHLDRDLSALGRYEKAEWPIKLGDVGALLDLYGVHESGHRERLLGVAGRIWHLHHWDGDPVTAGDGWFITPEWLAGRAEVVRAYHPNLMPGTVRHMVYSSYVKERSHAWLLVKRGLIRVEALVEQAVLRQELGRSGLGHTQLAHLAHLCQQPSVGVRVLADDGHRVPVLSEPVTLFVMPEPYPAVAMVDSLAGLHYREGSLAQWYTDAYRRLWHSALPEPESHDMINALVRDGEPPASDKQTDIRVDSNGIGDDAP